ncbi:hypothetical protein MMC19_005777 [Ptychographa xylographoides]|nr:hypothetical protein [Ptychographa xylographoides]
MDSGGTKRKAETGPREGTSQITVTSLTLSNVRQVPKQSRQWVVPRKNEDSTRGTAPSIQPGDAGIWATCDMHKEGLCTTELRDLFDEYSEKIYGLGLNGETEETGDDGNADIEADIRDEIDGLKSPSSEPLFQPVRIDVRCVVFFKTLAPIEPVSFVHHICNNLLHGEGRQKSRWTRRLTPMTLMGKATEKGLEEVSKAVLAPHFHAVGVSTKKDSSQSSGCAGRLGTHLASLTYARMSAAKLTGLAGAQFAIRTSIRNHAILKRDFVIKQVANAVGSPHTVDLTQYETLILVEVYKNMCGMAVVGSDYDQLRRYNLAEIHDSKGTATT